MKSTLLSFALLLAGLARADAPAIDTQPADTLAGLGEDVALAAAVSGTAPISCQWYTSAGGPVVGAVSDTLALPAVSLANAGSYYLVASNDFGCVTSRTARLVVCDKVWIGNGDGVSWSGAANWSGGAVPTSGDSVLIGEGSNTVNYAGGTLGNLLCRRKMNWQGATTVTGLVQVNQTLSLSSGTTLSASGTNANLSASVSGTVNYVSFYVTSGAKIRLSGSTCFVGGSAGGDLTLRSTGTGSVLDLPAVEQLLGKTAGNNYAVLVQAQSGGVINLGSLTNVPYGNVQFDATGSNSVLNLSKLKNFTATGTDPQDRMYVDSGGTILAGQLANIMGVSLYLNSGSSLVVTGLTHIAGGTCWGDVTIRVSGLGSVLNLSGVKQMEGRNRGDNYAVCVLAQSGGVINLGSLTNVPYGNVQFDATGSNSVLNLSALKSFTATGTDPQDRMYVAGGGTILAGQLANIVGVNLYLNSGSSLVVTGLTHIAGGTCWGDVTLLATGAGSVLDLSGVKQMEGRNTGNNYALLVQAQSGGMVNLGSLTNVPYGNVQFDATGSNSVLNLSALKSFTATGTDPQDRMYVAGGGTILAGQLANIVGVSLYLNSGSSLVVTGLTHIAGGTCWGDVTLLATGAGSVLDLSGVKQMEGRIRADNFEMRVQAQSGGVINLGGMTNVPAGNLSFDADGVNSVVNLSELGRFTGKGTMSQKNGGLILLKANATYQGVSFVGAPFILAHPQNVTALGSSQVMFSLSVAGSAPYSYLWLFNGAPLAGATNVVLNISSAVTSNAGIYSAIVSNAYGSVASSVATLTVTWAPVITQQPAEQRIGVGQQAAFTVGATGSPTPSIQWRHDGVNVEGATGATLTLGAAALSDAGLYDAVIWNSAGAVTSATARLSFWCPVTFDLGPHGTRAGGGELSQSVEHGGAAVAPEVQPEAGWAFEGWDTAFGSVTAALNVRAVYTPQVVIANVTAAQRPGTKLVDIGYDLYYGGTNALTIGVAVSNAAGVVSATSFSGDVGAGVPNGTGRRIVWDAGADQNGLVLTGLCVRVSAAVSSPEAGNYLVVDLSGGPTATNYPVTYLASVPVGGWSDEYKTTKLVLRRIPAGTFVMGSPTNEVGRELWDPQVYIFGETLHQVALTKAFYIGIFEVTQKQWERIMANWPSYFNNATYRDARPVEYVSYNDLRGSSAGANWPANNNVDATSFMGALRARTGRTFDLPTESQWEYACRAGTVTALNSGYDLTNALSDAHVAAVGRYLYNGGIGYTQNGDSSLGTAKVGSYLPNAWGLYDMHGNVWERCLDWYGTYPGTASDPKGVISGSARVNGGGGWNYNAGFCRAAGRGNSPVDYRSSYSGFRVTESIPIMPTLTGIEAAALNLDTRDYALTVASPHGAPIPPVGLHTNYCWRSAVTCAVEAAVSEGATNWTCVGWTATGSVQPEGWTTNLVAVLTNVASAVTWNWAPTAYWLNVLQSGRGQVLGGNEFVDVGGYAVLTGRPDDGWRFWKYATPDGTILSENNVYTNWAAGAVTVIGYFLPLPVAVIDLVEPAQPAEGAEIALRGHGDGVYAVDGYCWSVERLVDGVPDGQARAFCWSQTAVTTLSAGAWRISFQVCDAMASWSAPVTRDVTVASAATLSDLQVSRGDVRFERIDEIDGIEEPDDLEISRVATGQTVRVRVAVHNTGTADTPGPVRVALYESFGPTNLTSQTPAALTAVATGTVTHVAAGGVETVALPWTVAGADGQRTLTVVAEYAANYEAAVSNGVHGLSAALPVTERTLDNNLASAMVTVGDLALPPNLLSVTVQAGTMVAGRAGTVSGRAVYGWGQAYPVLGALVEVEIEGVSYVTTTRSPDGSFAVAVTAPAVGGHTATARVYDGFAVGSASCAFSCVPVPSGGGGGGGGGYWPPAPPPPTAPNLVVEAMAVGGNGVYEAESRVPHAQACGSVTVRALVRNASGFACSNTFAVSFGVGGQPLGVATVAGGPGPNEACWVEAPTNWLPTAVGTRTVTAEADSAGAVAETSETDNSRSQAVAVREPRPDLRPYRIVWNGTGWERQSGLGWTPSEPVAGEVVQVSATVYNCGTLPATAPFGVALLCDGIEVARSTVAESMGVGESREVEFLWPTAAVPPATHTLTAVVDDVDEVDEDDENNNATAASLRLYADTWSVRPFDLTVSPYPTVGDPCTLTARVRNGGGAAYPGGVAAFYVESPAYAPLGEGGVGALAAKGGEGVSAGVCWTPAATGPVRVYVEVDGRVYSEVFNVGEIPPDLRVLSADIALDPGSPQVGDDVRVRASVRNASASVAATNVCAVFEIAVREGVYAPLGAPRWIGALAPGASRTVEAGSALPDVGRGIYIVRVTLDAAGQGDADDGDNAATRSFGVELPVADAGADRACVLGETVTLDGGGSSNASNYFWRVADRPAGSVAAGETYTFAPVFLNHALVVHFRPMPVAGLTAQVTGLNSVGLAWGYGGLASAQFRVERQVGGGAWQTLGTVAGTAYTDGTVTEGMSLRYRVTAAVGVFESEGAEVTAEVPYLPAVPTGVGATAVSSDEVALVWNPAARAAGYAVQRRTLPLGEWVVAATLGVVTDWTDTSVAGGLRYAYRVRSVNAAGSSAFSAEVSVAVPQEPGLWGYGLLVTNAVVTVSGEAFATTNSALCGAPVGCVFDALPSNPDGVRVQHRVVAGLRDTNGVCAGAVVEINELTGTPPQPPVWVAAVALPPGLRLPEQPGTYVLWIEDYLDSEDPRGAFANTVSTKETGLSRPVCAFSTVSPGAGDAYVRLGAEAEQAGKTVDVPITISAMGGENAFFFSLAYEPAKIRLLSIKPGKTVASCYMEVNDATEGAVGVGMVLPMGVGLEPGLQELASVKLLIDGSVSAGTPIAVSFSDTPSFRLVTDAYANTLPHVWMDGGVTVAGVGYEADVSPRGMPDDTVDDKDKKQIMRFAVGLDVPAPGSEFQRADCAPVETRGDGRVDARDVVVAGRYAGGAEPLRDVGGPTAALSASLAQSAFMGETPMPQGNTLSLLASGLAGLIKIDASFGVRGEVIEVPVSIVSGGNIEGASFSVLFDPDQLMFLDAVPSAVCSNALDVLNSSGASAGRVGYVLRMPPGRALPAGSVRIQTLRFRVVQAASDTVSSIGFAEEPAPVVLANGSGGSVIASVQGANVYLLPVVEEGAPDTVDDLSATAEGGTRVRLAWGDVSGETGYALYRRSDCASWGLLAELPANAVSYVDSGLEPGRVYSYRIASVNAAGESSSDHVPVTLPTPYRYWADVQIGLSLGEPEEDQDGDGVSNYLEYLLGSDPAIPDAGLLRTGVDDMYGFGQEYFTLSLDVHGWALPSLSVDTTGDLRGGVWEAAAEVGNTEVDGKRRLTYRSQRSMSEAPAQFIRVRTVP